MFPSGNRCSNGLAKAREEREYGRRACPFPWKVGTEDDKYRRLDLSPGLG